MYNNSATRQPKQGRGIIFASGFTLIEIMAALTIFALMSAFAYRGLNAVANASARVEQETRKWSELALAFVNIQQSLTVVVDRPIRARDGLTSPAFIGVRSARLEEDAIFVFTRTGFSGHRGVLADVQRVGYRLRGGQLEQMIWPALDLAPGSEPQAVPLLTGITSLLVHYVTRDGSRHAMWPLAGVDAVFPAALEMTLQLTSGEQITRLFALS